MDSPMLSQGSEFCCAQSSSSFEKTGSSPQHLVLLSMAPYKMRGHFPLLLVEYLPALSLVRHSPLQKPFFHVASLAVGAVPVFCSACGFPTQPPKYLSNPTIHLRQPAAPVDQDYWTKGMGTWTATFRQNLPPLCTSVLEEMQYSQPQGAISRWLCPECRCCCGLCPPLCPQRCRYVWCQGHR